VLAGAVVAAGVLVPGTAAQAADVVDTGLTSGGPQAPAPLPKPSLPVRPPAVPQTPAPPKVTVPSTPAPPKVPAPVVTPPRTPTPPAPPVKISTPPVTPPTPKPVKPPVVGQPPASAPPPPVSVPPVQPPSTTPPPVQVPPVQVPPVGTPQPPVVTPPKVDPPVVGRPPQVVTPPTVQVPVSVSTPRAPVVAAAQTVTAASSSPATVAGGRLIPVGSKSQPVTTLGGMRPVVAGRLPRAVEVDRSPAPEPGRSTPTELTPLAIRNVITSTSPGELAHAYARPSVAAGSPLRRSVPVIERRRPALTFVPVVPTAQPTAMRALRLRLAAAAAPARAATARVPAGNDMAVTWAMIMTGSLGLGLTVLLRRQQLTRRRRD
jgi:hypothetical protein